MLTNNRNPKESIVVIVSILILLFLLKGFVFALWIALIISFLSLVSTKFTSTAQLFLTKTTYIIGQIVQKVTLTIVFFLILTPLALLSRIFGKKDIMMLKNNYDSTFIDCNEKIDKSYFRKLW